MPDIEDKEQKLKSLKEDYLTEKQEETDKKEKRKYKKRSKIELDESSKDFSNSVSSLGTFSFGLLISRFFPDNPLNEEEKKALNEATEKVALKYVNVLGNYKEEAGLVAVLLFVIVPRYMEKKSSEKKKEQEIKAED